MATTTPADLRAKLDKKEAELRSQYGNRNRMMKTATNLDKNITKREAEILDLKEKLVDLQG